MYVPDRSRKFEKLMGIIKATKKLSLKSVNIFLMEYFFSTFQLMSSKDSLKITWKSTAKLLKQKNMQNTVLIMNVISQIDIFTQGKYFLMANLDNLSNKIPSYQQWKSMAVYEPTYEHQNWSRFWFIIFAGQFYD